MTVSDVNHLVDRFFEARKMMRRWPGRRDAGHARDAGHGRQAREGRRQQLSRAGAKRGSGNPAKRAAEKAAASQRRATADNGAAAFGFGQDAWTELPEGFELPKELEALLASATAVRRWTMVLTCGARNPSPM